LTVFPISAKTGVEDAEPRKKDGERITFWVPGQAHSSFCSGEFFFNIQPVAAVPGGCSSLHQENVENQHGLTCSQWQWG
jgi:hypothetical protein